MFLSWLLLISQITEHQVWVSTFFDQNSSSFLPFLLLFLYSNLIINTLQFFIFIAYFQLKSFNPSHLLAYNPNSSIQNLFQQLYLSLFMKLAILLCLIFALAFTDSCGGNCPSGKCPSCPCGTAKAMQDIASWCGKHGWNQNCCKCIVSHESGGNAHSMNYNTNKTFDVGLWQINHVNWAGCSGGSAPCTPDASLKCAIKVYEGSGNTWRAWSTHTACGC